MVSVFKVLYLWNENVDPDSVSHRLSHKPFNKIIRSSFPNISWIKQCLKDLCCCTFWSLLHVLLHIGAKMRELDTPVLVLSIISHRFLSAFHLFFVSGKGNCVLYGLMCRDRYRYSIGYHILIMNLNKYCIEKSQVLYCVDYDFKYIYKIDLITKWVWRSPHESSLVFISEISEANCAKFNKIRFLGDSQFRSTFCQGFLLWRKYQYWYFLHNKIPWHLKYHNMIQYLLYHIVIFQMCGSLALSGSFLQTACCCFVKNYRSLFDVYILIIFLQH